MRAQRALYNRLMTTKSGQGHSNMSAAHAWTVKAWSFYKDHLLKAPSLMSHDVSCTTEEPQLTPNDCALELRFDFVSV